MALRFLIVLVQALYTSGDLLARANLKLTGFSPGAFWSKWFLVYAALRLAATFGQLYVFAHVELGRSMALFGAAAIVFSNLLGFLLLQETLSLSAYAGVSLAVVAFLVLAITS